MSVPAWPEGLPPEAVVLDLELQGEGLRVGAMVSGGQPWVFTAEHLTQVGLVVPRIPLLVGHNIRRFDLPRLERLIGALPADFDRRVVDTLELASLAFPGEPSQALDKLYREHALQSDPVEDCCESARLYTRCLPALAGLPPLVRAVARRLLPAGATRELIPEGEMEWTALHALPIQGEWAALRAYLEARPPGDWANLGAVVYLHWLLRTGDPACRRPAWVSQEFPSFMEAERTAFPSAWSDGRLRAELQSFYGEGYDFREGQLEIVRATLAGEVVPLGLLPTGGGKSLCFQFPALLLSKYHRALTVVVSPLQALMEDQVMNLRLALPGWGERATYLASSQSPLEQRKVLEDVWAGRADLLYVSPERLRNAGVQRLLRHRRPALWVLDEAHTLSQWGLDFRPDFLRIPQALREVHAGGDPPLVGFVTATATVKVIEDLETHFVETLRDVLGRPMKRVPELPAFQGRPEIATEVREVPQGERLSVIARLLTERRGQGVAIVYVRSRALCESHAEALERAGLRAAPYHARIPAAEKLRVLQAFKDGALDVVVATNAFGMGIDRPGIHTVIHAGPPSAPESYLQEIGRVARQPGERGHALMLWEERDFVNAFRLESQSRVGGPKALKDCWDLVKKRFELPPSAHWVSSLEFASILSKEDPEELTTQARVALFALEAYRLLHEGERQPARLRLRLLHSDAAPGVEALPLLALLRARGHQPGEELELDVRETALLAGLRLPKVVTAARQLVRSGHASWSYPVALRARRGARGRLDACAASLRAFAAHLRDHLEADLTHLNLHPVDADVRRRHRQADFLTALRVLHALDVARHRRATFHVHLTPVQEGARLPDWLADAEERFAGVRALADDLITRLAALPPGETLELNAADLDARFEAELGGLDALEALYAVQYLGLANVARGESETGGVFYLKRGQQPRYNKAAFRPLETHYADRARRLHAMRHLLQQPDEADRVELLRAYFTLPLEAFCQRHLPHPEAAATPQIPEYRERILGGLSEAQRRVVTDDESRAILVLAGPGSGKTRTIVHRVANLVALRDVNPERVLVLAYNRTAVAEVRERLAALIGGSGLHVDVLTFHALARKLTNLSERDAPREVQAEGRFDWLIGQAVAHLRENPAPYQYVLVDEYQDIGGAEYELVTLLASFDREGGPAGGEEDDREQPGYLVAVGDDDQNLYTFQGASIEFIHRFRQDYDIPAEKVVPLLPNYRSRPRIVQAANTFIEAALPADARLKEADQRVVSVREGEGQVRIGRYGHRYHAALGIARETASLIAGGSVPHEIAVLAREWSQLGEVQHALREAGVPYQLYNVHDQLRPSGSLLGSALRDALTRQPDALAPEAHATLEGLRRDLGLSAQDRAWSAILHATDGLKDVTWGTLALRLEAARPLARGGVVLSTYHSAKGSEFDHVFVLSEGMRRHGVRPPPDETRALYVALTRARESVTLLRREGDCHPTLLDPTYQAALQALGVEGLSLPTDAPLPPSIRYRLEPDPGDLYVSAPEVLCAEGRDAVTRYAREWGDLRLDGLLLHSPGGAVARLSRNGRLTQRLRRVSRQGNVRAVGRTVLRCERDDEWYAIAGYEGEATHHHLVLPEFEIQEPLNS
ncbi:ATP-dependent DNA helicase RecQ [Deinococcus sp. HSC-46F16]|uniref:RecQ family ATP-dependent DNA helicase n=1 Tax=Deinococcus sp. HSC-46F16 TaxID=2910968 RepID=UPI00209E276B|nr:ATP-dependent DNA helicase RecQ [Deinococcus sp. HSC-46F16]